MDGFGECYKEKVLGLNDKLDIGGRERSGKTDILVLL